MSELRTLIVDDEPIARQVLREELSGFDDVAVAGEAASGDEALAQIARLKPDLVLLDLQMPGLSGFDVIPVSYTHLDVYKRQHREGQPVCKNRLGLPGVD